ncbi:MAG: MbnP family protein [Flavobacterium psychrophilum]
MTKFNCLYLFILLPLALFGQESNSLFVQVDYNHSPLILGETYVSQKGDSLRINKFKWYLSDLKLHFTDGRSASIGKKYTLLDADSLATPVYKIADFKNSSPAYMELTIGIDSIPNTQGALSNELDVQNGMYWAWQSGYINWKIEGTSSSCVSTHKQQFTFHVGGYKAKQNALRIVQIPFPKNAKNILHIDLATFFNQISLRSLNSVQIPGNAAMQLADLFTKSFWLE